MAIGPEWCMEIKDKSTGETRKIYGCGDSMNYIREILHAQVDVDIICSTTGKLLSEGM